MPAKRSPWFNARKQPPVNGGDVRVTPSAAMWRMYNRRRAAQWARQDRGIDRRMPARFTRRPMRTDRMPIRSNTHLRYLQSLVPTVFGWL
jgi:uncharacterized protein (DUF2235 family)